MMTIRSHNYIITGAVIGILFVRCIDSRVTFWVLFVKYNILPQSAAFGITSWATIRLHTRNRDEILMLLLYMSLHF